MSGQSDLTDLGASEEERKKQAAIRYSKGIILPADDECHMSDRNAYMQSSVADPSAIVAGITVVKK